MYQDGHYLQPISQYSQTICQSQIMMKTAFRVEKLTRTMYIHEKQVHDCVKFIYKLQAWQNRILQI